MTRNDATANKIATLWRKKITSSGLDCCIHQHILKKILFFGIVLCNMLGVVYKNVLTNVAFRILQRITFYVLPFFLSAIIPSHSGHSVCCHGNGGLSEKFSCFTQYDPLYSLGIQNCTN